MLLKMDKGRLIQNGNGGQYSIVKIPPPPPPKPTSSKFSNGSSNTAQSSTNDNFIPPPPPPLPSSSSATTTAVVQDLQNTQTNANIGQTIEASNEGIGATVTENIQEEGKNFVGEAKDELLANLLGTEGEESNEEEPKSLASLLTKELLSLSGDSEETDDKEMKPSVVKSAVKKLIPKSGNKEDKEEDNEKDENVIVEESEKPVGDEKDEKSEPADDDDDDGGDDEDNCLSPKAFILSKIKPLLNQAKPYVQTILTNFIGVLIGAGVAYGTIQMGSDSGNPMSITTNSYRPIEKFSASPISGIRSETPQAWITIDLEPLIYGIKQLGIDGNSGGEGGFEVESTTLILNVTHRANPTNIVQNNDINNKSTADTTRLLLNNTLNPILRTHLVTFKVKRETDSNNNEIVSVNPIKTNTINTTIINLNNNTDSSEINHTMTSANNATTTTKINASSSSLSNQQLKAEPSVIVSHEQIGDELQFEDFIPLVPEVQNKLTHLHLQYLIISPQQLLESLKYAQNLRSLELIQVRLLGHFDGRVQLPSLTNFCLHVVNSSLISTLAPIKTFLFFDKDGYWRFEKISSLGVDIELIFDDRKYFRITHKKQQLISQLILTNVILEHLDSEQFQLQQLALSFVQLNIDLVPSTITHLSLYSVTFDEGQRLELLLHKLKSLESLELNNIVGSTLVISDLSSSSLKHLAYGRSNIQYAPGVFLDLDSIYLENIVGDAEFFDKFHHLFNGSRVAVSALSLTQPHSFLKKILQLSAVEWIYMENFDRQPTIIDNSSNTLENSNANNNQSQSQIENNNVIRTDFDEIEWFLITSGVPSNVEVFLLEKNPITGLWSGRGVTIEQHRYLWFNLFEMEKFWTKNSVDIFNGMKGQKFITYYLSKSFEFDELITN